jgi:hypothetical protein
VRFFHSLTETERHLRESVHPRYQLEIGLVKLIEMRRLAPLGQLVERLNSLEEALRTGKAPAGDPGAQTPPAAPAAGGPARRGSAAGGGPASFQSPEPVAAGAADTTTPTPTPEARAQAPSPGEPLNPAGVAPNPTGAAADFPKASPPAAAAPPPPKAEPPRASHAGASQSFGAGRPAVSSPPALKLVPTPPKSPVAADAPFNVGAPPSPAYDGPPASFFDEPPSFFEEVRAGRDAVGPPVALGPPPPEPPPRETAPPADSTAARIKRGLEDRGKPFLAVAFEGARRVVVEGDEVQVEFAPDGKHLRDMLSKPESMRLLREVCCDVLGRQVGVGFALRTPGESADLPLSREDEERLEQKRLREFAENHPFVQEVLKTFRGEIIEVRRVEE